MAFKIENKPVGRTDPLMAEAAALLPTLKVGQSFVVPASIGNGLRQRAAKVPGMKFGSSMEDDGSYRIGRVA